MIYQETPDKTYRLFLYKDEFPEKGISKELLTILGVISIWGGIDVRGEDYLSWEFCQEMHEVIILNILTRLNCNLRKL